MISEVTFFVPGIPIPKQRARTVRTKTGKIVSFTPKRTARWEATVRAYAVRACCAAGWRPTEDPCDVDITVHRGRRAGDADNFAKSFTDACNGVLYVDDRHVRRLKVSIIDGQTPGIQARITRTVLTRAPDVPNAKKGGGG